MPRLPDVKGQSSAQVPMPSGGIATFSPDVFRDTSGAGMSGVGREIQEAASIIAATNDRQDQQVALSASNKMQEAAMQLQFDPEKGYQNIKGEQAVGRQFVEKYSQQFKDQSIKIRESLGNENQKKNFDRQMQVLGLQYQGNLLKHQARETEQFNDQTDDSAIKLQLRAMASDPTNDLSFQTGLVQINGVIDNIAKRKGLPAAQAEELKAQYIDASYTARITAVMDGVPGVLQADPRTAQAMFKQVEGQLGPTAKIQLGKQITKAVTDLDARDTARRYVFDPDENTGQPPSANELKVDVYKRVQAARDEADKQRPGDIAYADAVAARVQNYASIVIQNQVAQEAEARDSLVKGMMGSNPDGSQAPQTMDQLLSNPDMKRAWDTATPSTQQAIQNHFKNGGGSPTRNAGTQAILYQYMGKAAMDRDGFASEDLSHLITKLPYADFDKLANLQLAARNRSDRDAEKAANMQRALSLAMNYALKPIGIGIPTQSTSAAKREQYEQFTGRLSQWMEDFQVTNKRAPNDKEIIAQSKNLTAAVQVPGFLFGTNDKPGFALKPEDESRATVKLTPEQSISFKTSLKTRYGFEPTEAMIQQAALIQRLYPNDLARLRQFDQTMRDLAKKGGSQ